AAARYRQMFEALMNAPVDAGSNVDGFASDEPIFVMGMPRSGTTLVDRIISSHPQVYSAGELQSFPMAFKYASGQRDGLVSTGRVLRCQYPPGDRRQAALRRQASTQFPLRGIHRPRVAAGQDHLPASRPDGQLPQQFPPVVRTGIGCPRILVRPARYRSLLRGIRSADGALAATVSRAHPGSAVRIAGGRAGAGHAAAAGILRPAMGRRLPAFRGQPGADRHGQRGAGAPADESRFGRTLAALRRTDGGFARAAGRVGYRGAGLTRKGRCTTGATFIHTETAMVTIGNGMTGENRMASDRALRDKNRFWFEKPATRFGVYFC